MTQLGLKTSDNDFHKTWISVLRTINQYIKQYPCMTWKRPKLLYTIKKLAYPHYLLFQQDEYWLQSYEKSWDSETEKRVEKYLNEMHVELLIDDEVDNFKKSHPWGYNYSFFILDTRLDYPNNDPVYSY